MLLSNSEHNSHSNRTILDTDDGRSLSLLIVGFGSIGKRHFNNLKQIENVEASVLTRRQGLNISGTRVYYSLEEALNQDFDAVFITNETSLHISVALPFAERGFNLFIEKPLSNSMRDVDRLVDLANRNGLKVVIGCDERFRPMVKLVKGFIQEDKAGRIISARIEAGQYLPDWHPWQDYRDSYSASKEMGGGVILDLIHELDYAHWLFGEMSRVFCFSSKKSDLEIQTEDVAEILIEFQNGTLCEVHLDYIQRYPCRSIELIGTKGTIRADIVANKVNVFEAERGDWELIDLGSFETNKMYIDEVNHFINYIRGSAQQPLTGLDTGVKILKVALAAKESSLLGKVVEV